MLRVAPAFADTPVGLAPPSPAHLPGSPGPAATIPSPSPAQPALSSENVAPRRWKMRIDTGAGVMTPQFSLTRPWPSSLAPQGPPLADAAHGRSTGSFHRETRGLLIAASARRGEEGHRRGPAQSPSMPSISCPSPDCSAESDGPCGHLHASSRQRHSLQNGTAWVASSHVTRGEWPIRGHRWHPPVSSAGSGGGYAVTEGRRQRRIQAPCSMLEEKAAVPSFPSHGGVVRHQISCHQGKPPRHYQELSIASPQNTSVEVLTPWFLRT